MQFSDPNDLLYRFLRNDEKALKEVYRFCYNSLCYNAIAIVTDYRVAEEIVSESFLVVWNIKHTKDFSSLDDLIAFLYVIVKNRCLNELKRQKRRPPTFPLESGYMISAEDNDETARIIGEILQAAYEEINNLPPRCREAFKLHFINRLSTKEIALKLDMKEQTVLNHISLGRKFISRALAAKNLPLPLIIIFLYGYQ